ncbi:unnamed protein product [Lathyrus oleraceus]
MKKTIHLPLPFTSATLRLHLKIFRRKPSPSPFVMPEATNNPIHHRPNPIGTTESHHRTTFNFPNQLFPSTIKPSTLLHASPSVFILNPPYPLTTFPQFSNIHPRPPIKLTTSIYRHTPSSAQDTFQRTSKRRRTHLTTVFLISSVFHLESPNTKLTTALASSAMHHHSPTHHH